MTSNTPPEDYDQAINLLVRLKVEVVWNGGPKFKKIAGRSGYNVTNQWIERGWPLLVGLLKLNTKEDTDRIRREVRRRLQV